MTAYLISLALAGLITIIVWEVVSIDACSLDRRASSRGIGDPDAQIHH